MARVMRRQAHGRENPTMRRGETLKHADRRKGASGGTVQRFSPHGLPSGGSPLVAERGVEDGGENITGNNIGYAGDEVRHARVAAVSEEVGVVGVDSGATRLSV